MELNIEVGDDAGSDLYRWLVDDPQVRRFAADAEPVADADTHVMGLAFDVLNLVVPNAVALGSLVVSIAAFREQRRQSTGAAPTVNIQHAGVLALVDGDGAEAVRRLTAAAAAAAVQAAPGGRTSPTDPAAAIGGQPAPAPASGGRPAPVVPSDGGPAPVTASAGAGSGGGSGDRDDGTATAT